MARSGVKNNNPPEGRKTIRMKKYLSIILIAFLTISLTSCATYATMSTNTWLEYELPPSRIVKSGEIFFEGKLCDL
ncbi:MAG: hypothetical protein Q8S11_09110 [Daejeonella sp.]|nr:hypothetical protein [Daejeonella sp.]